MEEHLYALLAAAVPFPVAWGTLGSGSTTPRAALYRVGALRDMTLDGPGLVQGRVQIDCYGENYAQALTASRAIRTALEGYRGGPVLGAFLEAVRDGFDDDAALLHRVSMIFSVTYRE